MDRSMQEEAAADADSSFNITVSGVDRIAEPAFAAVSQGPASEVGDNESVDTTEYSCECSCLGESKGKTSCQVACNSPAVAKAVSSLHYTVCVTPAIGHRTEERTACAKGLGPLIKELWKEARPAGGVSIVSIARGRRRFLAFVTTDAEQEVHGTTTVRTPWGDVRVSGPLAFDLMIEIVVDPVSILFVLRCPLVRPGHSPSGSLWIIPQARPSPCVIGAVIAGKVTIGHWEDVITQAISPGHNIHETEYRMQICDFSQCLSTFVKHGCATYHGTLSDFFLQRSGAE